MQTEKKISYKGLRENPKIKKELKYLGEKYLINKFYELKKQGKVKTIERGFFEIQNF